MLKHLCLFCVLLLMSEAALSAYEAVVFGDVHFDSADVRDSSVTLPAHQVRQMNRNLARWQEDIPAMLDMAAKKAGKDTAFVVQLGDICQGDCGSQALHEKSLNTVLPMFVERFPNLRFLTIPGNHDIRGAGAEQGYKAVMVPYLSKTLGQQLSPDGPVQYAFVQENDLFVFMDSNEPSLEFLKKALEEHPTRRHLFVLTHLPVLPLSPGRPLWTVFDRQPRNREPLLKVLAENHALVLCAHVHFGTLVRWKSEAGNITQVSLFSMFDSRQNAPSVTDRVPEKHFAKFMGSLTDTPKDKGQKEILAKYLQGYTEFKEIRPAAGVAVLKASDSSVTLELYAGKELGLAHSLKLK